MLINRGGALRRQRLRARNSVQQLNRIRFGELTTLRCGGHAGQHDIRVVVGTRGGVLVASIMLLALLLLCSILKLDGLHRRSPRDTDSTDAVSSTREYRQL